jgi:hypothetical protein
MWREPREPSDDHGLDPYRRRTEPGGLAGGMARMFGQMMMLPLVTFVYAVEAFARALREIQHTGDRTLDAFTGRDARQHFDLDIAGPRADMPSQWHDAPGRAGGTDYAALNVSAGALSQSTPTVDQTHETEEREMAEQELRGDDLKLVRWTIAFTRRDLEVALGFGIELVDYSTSLGDYQGSKKVEFVNKLKNEGVERPQKWVDEDYPDEEYIEKRPDPPRPGEEQKEYVTGLPSDDTEKFLRVRVEVLDHYEKDDADYEKDQTDALRGIQKELSRKNKP